VPIQPSRRDRDRKVSMPWWQGAKARVSRAAEINGGGACVREAAVDDLEVDVLV
jgi:hypothetical protein